MTLSFYILYIAPVCPVLAVMSCVVCGWGGIMEVAVSISSCNTSDQSPVTICTLRLITIISESLYSVVNTQSGLRFNA